jgi:hypothetical protein
LEWPIGEEVRKSDIPAKPEPGAGDEGKVHDDGRRERESRRAGEEEIRVRVRNWDGRLERESRRGTYLPSRSLEPETMTRDGGRESRSLESGD